MCCVYKYIEISVSPHLNIKQEITKTEHTRLSMIVQRLFSLTDCRLNK